MALWLGCHAREHGFRLLARVIFCALEQSTLYLVALQTLQDQIRQCLFYGFDHSKLGVLKFWASILLMAS